MAEKFIKEKAVFARYFSAEQLKVGELLSEHTTLKIGGPADLFLTVKTNLELVRAIRLAIQKKVPYTVLGSGSNVLISDQGLRGLVIKNEVGFFTVVKRSSRQRDDNSESTEEVRLQQYDTKRYYAFADLDFDDRQDAHIEVKVSAGMPVSVLINRLLKQGVAGLQWFVGIPGTIGGAVYNNIHGGTHHLSSYFVEGCLVNKKGEIKRRSLPYFHFRYDGSNLHHSEEILLEATLSLPTGHLEKARYVAQEWAKRKKIQPRNSAGSTFANLSQKQQAEAGLASGAVGYLIDHLLGWKGRRRGKAAISMVHANFIVNEGGATAQDYYDLMSEIQAEFYSRWDLHLRPEIKLLGFNQK